MIVKACVAAALIVGTALSPSAALAQAAIDTAAIVVVTCGTGAGTAFWISPHRLVTAQHVTTLGPCSVNGVHVTTAREDPARDISELHSIAASEHFLPILCEPMREGETYIAYGFPATRLVHAATLMARAETVSDPAVPQAEGMRILEGRIYPGMSGGPQIRGGAVQGITNRGTLPFLPIPPIAASRQLVDTFLCDGDRP